MAQAAEAKSEGGGGGHGPSLPLCKLCGVPVRVHALLPVVTLLAVGSAVASGGGVAGGVLAALVNGPLLFGTVLAHEMGHILAARKCGLVPEHILLWPMGGLAVIGPGDVSPKGQIFISGMGPATHLPMLALWALTLALCNRGRVTLSLAGLWLERDFAAIVCVCLLVNNLAMLIFNLLVPCFPLDCSQILISALLLRGQDNSTIAKIVVGLSIPVIIVLAGLGAWSYLAGNYGAALNIFVAAWLATQTYQLHKARTLGLLNLHPLFARAVPPPPPTTTGGVVLGSQACAGAVLSLATLAYALRATLPPS